MTIINSISKIFKVIDSSDDSSGEVSVKKNRKNQKSLMIGTI